MKFTGLLSLGAALAFIGLAAAVPAPQDADTATVHHCGGDYNLACPKGWRCCGPIVLGVGGTCFKGATGLCPL